MMYVKKFGGSSLANPDRIRSVAKIIQCAVDAGEQVVVVVSAMEGETDRLIQLMGSFSDQPNPREFDAIVATGEQVSAALLAIALVELGIKSRSYTAAQAGIHTDACHGRSRIVDINTQSLKDALYAAEVPIVTGYQGVSASGDVTTFGRGGSDLSAVALAAALQADECQIYTDVEGVYTCDPRVVSEAHCLDIISYQEMQALASVGAKVLQPRSVRFAHKYNIPVRVCSSFVESTGTLVKHYEDQSTPVFSGVAFATAQTKLTLISMPCANKNYSEIITANMQAAGVPVAMMVTSESLRGVDLSFTVPSNVYATACRVLETLSSELNAKDRLVNDGMSVLSLIGSGMKAYPSIASKFCAVLGAKNIVVHLINASEVKISAVIDASHADHGAKLLHDEFITKS